MRNFQPTYGVRDTAQNIKFFLEANNDLVWKIFRPLAPYILVLHFMDMIVTSLYFQDSKSGFFLGSLLASYFYTVFVISWHRVIIHGPDYYIPMDPFHPKKGDLAFIGMGFLVACLAMGAFIVFILLGALLSKSTASGELGGIQILTLMTSIFTGLFFLFYLIYKFSFVFPACAVGNRMTLGQSFALTRGYFRKLCVAPIVASGRLLLMVIGYLAFAILITFGLFYYVAENSPQMQEQIQSGAEVSFGWIGEFFGFVIDLPMLLYFQPLLYAIGVTALSNYYLHALQNRNDTVDL